MQFKYHMPTKVVWGKSCIEENSHELKAISKKAFIVTGGKSGRLSGALLDIENALTKLGIPYKIFDRIENNPTLENVAEAGKEAKAFGADCIIGIGGGSPLDAAKAVAVLAVNDIEPIDLYKNSFAVKPLPVVAVPTTAGTGSEVTPYSILTRKDLQTKMSFGTPDTFPVIAYMDAKYTESLPHSVTVDTAIDAFSHSLEGYVSKRSMPVSDIIAEKAIAIFGECLDQLAGNKLNFDTREKLLYVSMLGGMVISHTGTTVIHGMGYSLTYFKDIPHGRANGILLAETMRYNYDIAREKVDNVLRMLGMKDIDQLAATLKELLLKEPIDLSEDEVKLYASMAMKQRSAANNVREVDASALEGIIKNSLS